MAIDFLDPNRAGDYDFQRQSRTAALDRELNFDIAHLDPFSPRYQQEVAKRQREFGAARGRMQSELDTGLNEGRYSRLYPMNRAAVESRANTVTAAKNPSGLADVSQRSINQALIAGRLPPGAMTSNYSNPAIGGQPDWAVRPRAPESDWYSKSVESGKASAEAGLRENVGGANLRAARDANAALVSGRGAGPVRVATDEADAKRRYEANAMATSRATNPSGNVRWDAPAGNWVAGPGPVTASLANDRPQQFADAEMVGRRNNQDYLDTLTRNNDEFQTRQAAVRRQQLIGANSFTGVQRGRDGIVRPFSGGRPLTAAEEESVTYRPNPIPRTGY